MKHTDPRIDDYIAKAQPFAQPILQHLRSLVHQANPEVTETIKWGMPFFDYKGPYCNMASFKEHVVFGFWKSALLKDPKHYLGERASKGGEAMGNLGRIVSLESLPPDDAIKDFLQQAKKLNDEGKKTTKAPAPEKGEMATPDFFLAALKKHKQALEVFNGFPPSAKKDYIEWITEAKTEATRQKRLATAIEWISEGKRRNWKYEQDRKG